MNKKSILYLLLDLVLLTIFNTLYFLVGGTDRPASVWISFFFIHIAFFLTVATPFLMRKSSSATVFGLPLLSVSSVYFLAAFVAGVLFVLIGSDSYEAALVIQLIITGIYAILLIIHLIANEHAADSAKRHEAEVAYIKDISSRVQALMDMASDKKANKRIEKLYNLLCESPTRSLASVKELEQDIKDRIGDLENAVSFDDTDAIIDTADDIMDIAEKRNRKLKKVNV